MKRGSRNYIILKIFDFIKLFWVCMPITTLLINKYSSFVLKNIYFVIILILNLFFGNICNNKNFRMRY